MPRLKNKKELPYPVEKVFDVAMDIEDYPKILPYIRSVKILTKDKDRITASLTLGLSFLKFTYQCDIHYKNDTFIAVTSKEPLFNKFESKCFFKEADNKTVIEYELDAQFNNPIFEFMAGMIMPYQTSATLNAFERYLRKA